MSEDRASRTDSEGIDNSERAGYVVPLLILFVASGCAALIYEIVWFQLLQLVIGSSAISLGVLLGAFMGGMCLGSLLFPRLVSGRPHPLRVYALLEIAIGLLGLASLAVIPWATQLYSQVASTGTADLFMRALISLICLLPPTILMGATLPAIARWMKPNVQGASRLGLFYGANTAGAVLGCLLAGFFLLRLFDMATATYVAVGINFGAGIFGLASSLFLRYRHNDGQSEESSRRPSDEVVAGSRSRKLVYLAVALSGCCALGSEVIWTRQLALVLGATVYSFSIILAVFLAGLGIGSSCGAALTRRLSDPCRALAWIQLLAAASIAWAGFLLAKSIPYWPFLAELADSHWLVFPMDIFRAACTVLPGAICWGMSFPLALAALAGSERDTGRLVGRVYAANTVGAIVGAIGFSIFFVGWIGTQTGQQTLIITSGVCAALMILASRRSDSSEEVASSQGFAKSLFVAATVAASYLLVTSVPQTPPELIGFGHRLAYFRFHERIGNDPLPKFEYNAEGMNSSIAVSTRHDGIRSIHVNGKVVASTGLLDMRIQRMLGHLPSLIHGEPKSVLIVGCGTGVTAGTFTCYPSIERIVVCELEPLIPEAAGEYFSKENHAVFKDPRVELHIDDARHFILSTDQKFDIITSDPIHPWAKGAASLYSREYFELCKKKLNPGGIVTQWVPLYETDLESTKSVLATFRASLPHYTLWCNELQPFSEDLNAAGGQPRGVAHDLVLLGRAEDVQIDVAAFEKRIQSNDKVSQALGELGLGQPLALLSMFAGRDRDLTPLLKSAQINTDANLRLQFLAGMAITEQASPKIVAAILEHLKFPKDLFVNLTAETASQLRWQLHRRATQYGSGQPTQSSPANTGALSGQSKQRPRRATHGAAEPNDDEFLGELRGIRDRILKMKGGEPKQDTGQENPTKDRETHHQPPSDRPAISG